MKTKFLALVITTVVSFSVNASDTAAAQEAVAHASRMADAAQGDVNSVNSNYGKGSVSGWADAANQAGAFRSQSLSDLNSANQALHSANSPVASQLTSVSKDMETANIAGAINTGKTGNTTINVAASSLAPSTKVKTDKGIVTAGTLPKDAQVTVSFNSVFSTPVKGGNDHSTGRSNGEHGTGNGANNAANSNSAHGLGGGSNIGGGRSGGGFHY